MKNYLMMATVAVGVLMMTGPAFAQVRPLPEPMSLSLVFGGVAAIAAIRGLRRK